MSLSASLESLSSKLGIKQTCVPSACEFHELLETRVNATSMSALRLPGQCRHVICLDLAARQAGVTPDKNSIVRLSGLTKKGYGEAFKVISALLEVEERLSLRELAVQFGCTKVIPQAAAILKRYTRDQCGDMDFSAPMFTCASLLVAARSEKVKIDSVKLKEKSGAKKSTFERLVAELQKYVVEKSDSEPKKHGSSRKRGGLMDAIDAQIQEDEQMAKISRLEGGDEVESDNINGEENGNSYEDWKRQILAKAAKKSPS